MTPTELENLGENGKETRKTDTTEKTKEEAGWVRHSRKGARKEDMLVDPGQPPTVV